MVVLNKIYTKTGDAGETALGNGARVAKHSTRVESYGTVDECNATVGMARLHAEGEMDARLELIQNDLFDLGADLATPESDGPALRITDEQVTRLETEIDAMNASLEPLTSFILPGGSQASAWLHLARTVVRRAERRMTELSSEEVVSEPAMRYVNRLSDHLFVLARNLNDGGKTDVLWRPGQNSGQK